MNSISTLIIGAGPAGLAVAGRLANRGVNDYLVLEATQKIGNAWRHHYDRLHLHTVKQLSHLPHLPFPKDYPTYVPRASVVEYLDNYAAHFNIKPNIEEKVINVKKKDSLWKVETSKSNYEVKNVVVATGVNNIPRIPDWPGLDKFNGDTIHSRFYKNHQKYQGKKVLVIGMGNTGAEIAFDLADNEIEVLLSVRSAISLVPRDLNGQPVQLTARKLAKLPFGFGDWLGSQIRKVYFGNLEKYGLPVSKVHPAVQLRETGKTPVIDIGTIAAIKDGRIKVIADIQSFDHHEVQTIKGEKFKVDCVILATGYEAALPSFIPGIEQFLDNHHLPKSPIGTDDFNNMYFIGFDNYKLGGILGTINDDSEKIINQILK